MYQKAQSACYLQLKMNEAQTATLNYWTVASVVKLLSFIWRHAPAWGNRATKHQLTISSIVSSFCLNMAETSCHLLGYIPTLATLCGIGKQQSFVEITGNPTDFEPLWDTENIMK